MKTFTALAEYPFRETTLSALLLTKIPSWFCISNSEPPALPATPTPQPQHPGASSSQAVSLPVSRPCSLHYTCDKTRANPNRLSSCLVQLTPSGGLTSPGRWFSISVHAILANVQEAVAVSRWWRWTTVCVCDGAEGRVSSVPTKSIRKHLLTAACDRPSLGPICSCVAIKT